MGENFKKFGSGFITFAFRQVSFTPYIDRIQRSEHCVYAATLSA
jgi:hypothetical protein